MGGAVGGIKSRTFIGVGPRHPQVSAPHWQYPQQCDQVDIAAGLTLQPG